ncbi:MAG: hypothetical protein HYS17_03440 [Micavibrio aeruginosavorus]|uniref:SF3 helicase domain-containing protein n=1 Tax=Micavibrio aeruginosavorus TaxID=349221 RepID=A0A7T5R3E4_9BACT|nr:MAG: hypothetical protein HYS17_03440 [Micavibrio aeruginosavorus]
MAKKKKEESEENRPEFGADALRAILEGAEGAEFEETLPQNIPPYDSLPEIDRRLSKIERNDFGNGQRLVARYGHDLISVPKAGWYGWTGQRWSLQIGAAMAHKYSQRISRDLRGEVIAAMAAGPKDDEPPKDFMARIKAHYKFSFDSGNTTRISAIMREAEPHLQKEIDAFDTHHFLLNLKNGTLNLKAEFNDDEDFDGIVLEEHQRKNLITKVARVSYDRDAQAPVFNKFIREVMPDDEVRLFLQRFFGYCLTGDTGKQVIVMLWGEGSNGKSTLMDLFTWMLGDYATVTPFASLLHTDQRRGSEASPDLARLPGARLVSAAEPESGARFAESMLKQLTGSEIMTVRHLHKDFFEFKPQFKLCLSFNNKPYIRGQDEGIWRRILLVPFTQRFVDEDQLGKFPGALPKIENLDKKLKAEAPGILNWLLDGYRMWAESGLKIPDKVRAATTEYRHESNPVHQFLDAWCEMKAGATIPAARLYDAYKLWCKDAALDPLNQNKFGRRMSEMNIERYTYQYVYYRGVQLSSEAESRLIEEENKQYRRRDGGDS